MQYPTQTGAVAIKRERITDQIQTCRKEQENEHKWQESVRDHSYEQD